MNGEKRVRELDGEKERDKEEYSVYLSAINRRLEVGLYPGRDRVTRRNIAAAAAVTI